MLPTLALLAALNQSAPTPLSLEHRMLLRCSAAFATVAQGQANGSAEALVYPDLRENGREFFVSASAQVMDEAGLDREQIAAALATEAQDLRGSETLEQIMPACLALLPAA
ncbi:MAG: hypothetical protein JY451_01815 [Erythrobacter sp.]|nr:MAG: hypothetical protein JY451_01815 [Erythrobacter sp.]